MALFSTNATWGSEEAQYAVARDGRFLVNQTREGTAALPITLIQHWNPEALRARSKADLVRVAERLGYPSGSD